MKILQILIISALIGVTMSILIQFPFALSDSGSLTGFDARSPDLSNMSLVLYDKFEQVSSNSTKDLYLEFFDEKNKTLVKNVSFFVNATRGDTVLMHELFYTHTGIMTLKFSPGSNTEKWVINGTAEPVLGGMMSNNDMIPIEMSAFTQGTYHFHIEVLALVYANGIVDQTHPPTFDSWWSVDDKGNISKDINSTTISKIKNAAPLKQFKSGVAADDVKCGPGLQLVIKTKDGSPACARPQTAQKLVERKWGWAMQPIDSIKPLPNRIMGLEDNTGIVTFGNQNYYFVTPNYTDTAYSNPVQVSFHDVVFTLFPPGFRGGLPSGDCESYDTVSKIVAGGGSYYWADAKFSDGAHELLHMFADSQPCPIYPKQTMFSNHTNPQAGLTFYDGKMKLLVSTDNQVSPSINYTESKIADDATYLSQTVDEWKSKTPEQLRAYYEKYKDAFYDELGSFLIKDEMKKELARQNIQNIHDDFKVFPGMTLDSLPPHISYDAVVNATDGNSYLLLGGVSANQIESSPKIIKLVFDKNALHSLSTGERPSFVNPFEKAPKIVISEQSGTNPVVVPYNLALDLDKNNTVTFYNNLTVSIRIQPYGSGLTVDESGLGWKSKVIGPHEMVAVQFNKTGYYEWDARSPPQGSENWWGFHGGGQIAAFSLNHDNSTSSDKLRMAQVFVSNSDIPWSSTGIGNADLQIGLYGSIYYMIPDAQKYYVARALQLIPFNVPIEISSP